jgi:hypothetical protein
MVFLSRDSRVGVPKLRHWGLPRLWSPITLWADLGSRCSLEQSCNSSWEVSNGMWYVVCKQVNRVNSWLFVVRSQIGNLTPDPSFGNNVCFKFFNEKCEPILEIYILRAFQWYKKCHKPLSFDPWNCSLKFRESTGTPSPKVGVALGVWVFTPSHSLTFSYIPESMWCDSRASSWPAPLRPLCLDSRASSWPTALQPLYFSREPKARVTTPIAYNSAFQLARGKVVILWMCEYE